MEVVLNRHMPAADSDADLVRQVAEGNENALRELYHVYGQRLYAYALRVTGDPAAAEEAVQESLVAAWQGAGRFRGVGAGGGRVIAWLLGIVHHKALNQARWSKVGGRVIESLEADEWDAPAGDALPEAQAAASEQRRLVRAGLDRLSMDHRLTLELIFYQGLSLKEAADVCGCPVGTVKSRLNYAKASLRGALSRVGWNAEEEE